MKKETETQTVSLVNSISEKIFAELEGTWDMNYLNLVMF